MSDALATPDIDPHRFRGLIEWGIAQHPDQAAVERYLAAGAEFHVRRTDDAGIEIALSFTERSPDLAAVRAMQRGTAGRRPSDEDLARPLVVVLAPASTIRPTPQG